MPVKAKGKSREMAVLGVAVNETSRIWFPVNIEGWTYLLSTCELANRWIFSLMCLCLIFVIIWEITQYKLTLNDMNYVLIWAHKSSIHSTIHPELLFQGFRVAIDQSVASTFFVDVNLCSLQGCNRTWVICTQLLWFNVRAGQNMYLD